MRLLFGFLMICFWAFTTQATAIQKPVKPLAAVKKAAILRTDSSNVQLRKFDEQAIKKYSAKPEFVYDDVLPKTLSLWDKFWRWFWRWVSEFFSGKATGNIIKYVLIGLVIAIVVFIVIKVIGLDLKLFSGKSKKMDIPFTETLENIHEIDFDEELEKALQSGNYRLVVRLLYLKTLKQLTDKSLIDWQPEKTNQAYVAELADEQYKLEFSKLTKQFEYIWYGEFFIDRNTFEPIQQSFQQFNQQTT